VGHLAPARGCAQCENEAGDDYSTTILFHGLLPWIGERLLSEGGSRTRNSCPPPTLPQADERTLPSGALGCQEKTRGWLARRAWYRARPLALLALEGRAVTSPQWARRQRLT